MGLSTDRGPEENEASQSVNSHSVRTPHFKILLVLCIVGFLQFVSRGSRGGGGGGGDSPGLERHGHPQWNPGKPKSFSNGTMFILDKELENLAQLQGGQPQIHLTLTLRDVI